MDSYETILEEASDEFVEKHSRFIGTVCPVDSEENALKRISAMRVEHRDARHNCYAFLVREGNLMRYSDDGEPQGTAGLPMLEVLRREGLTDILVISTRYFGGTLLGAGGLTRAYARSAKLALDAAKRVTMCECAILSITATYSLYDRILKLLEEYPAHILDSAFTDNISLQVRMRADSLDNFSAKLTELSAGAVLPELLSREFAAI